MEQICVYVVYVYNAGFLMSLLSCEEDEIIFMHQKLFESLFP